MKTEEEIREEMQKTIYQTPTSEYIKGVKDGMIYAFKWVIQ